MEPTPQTFDPSQRSIRVAECWADLTRSLTLYPETNSRVLTSLATFLEVLGECLHEVSRIEVGFSARSVWIGDDSYPLNLDSNLGWLKQRLEKGGLSGAVFSGRIEEESLIGFTKKLLELYTRRELDLTFEQLWPESFTGLSLLEKRFDGAFSDRHDDEQTPDRPNVAGRSRRVEETLSNALTKDDRIRQRMSDLQRQVVTAASKDQDLSSIDLLGSIVELLPEEALNNYQTAVDLTLKVLETVEQQITKGEVLASLDSLEDDNTFQRLLFVISRTHFSRIDPGKRPDRVKMDDAEEVDQQQEKEEAKKRENVVRAGDERIDDSLEALEQEMEELAPLETAFLRTEDLEDFGEQLGVYLHYLVRLEKPHLIPALQEGIQGLVRAPDNDTVSVLREYLEPLASEGGQKDGLYLSRVAMWLRRQGRRDLLKRCGVLTADWICREFPEEFLVYVNTLDLADELDLAELDGVCAKIGRERFAAAKDLFTGATEFLDGPLPKRLLLLETPGVTPFLQQIFDKRRRYFKTEFAHYLRRVVAKSLDKKILEVLDGSKFVLSEYLHAIADDDEKKLQEQRLSILYSFIVATDEDLNRVSQRERAIKLLANFDRPHIRAFLKRLVSARKFLIVPEQPRRIRQAASAVLRSYRGK